MRMQPWQLSKCPGCDRYVQLVLFLGWLLVAMCFGGKQQTGYRLVGSVVMMTRETKKTRIWKWFGAVWSKFLVQSTQELRKSKNQKCWWKKVKQVDANDIVGFVGPQSDQIFIGEMRQTENSLLSMKNWGVELGKSAKNRRCSSHVWLQEGKSINILFNITRLNHIRPC